MTLKTKVGGEWKDISALKVKINGEWKDVSTLYSKKDGAWVTVYSSGALITFSSYPYPIPVAKGWKYSTNKVNWTTVTSDSTINKSGTFTGYVMAKGSITLSNYYTTHQEATWGNVNLAESTLRYKRYKMTSFVNKSIGYVCGGMSSIYYPPVGGGVGTHSYRFYDDVDKFDRYGTQTYTYLSDDRASLCSFVNNSKGYVCGGYSKTESNNSSTTTTTRYSRVDVFDSSGNRTNGTDLSVKKSNAVAFTVGTKGFVCGGQVGRAFTGLAIATANVDIYSKSGSMTTGPNLSYARFYSIPVVIGSLGYVCGGTDENRNESCETAIDIFDSNGNLTTGTLPVGKFGGFALTIGSKGFLCSNNSGDNRVMIIDSSGNITFGSHESGLVGNAGFSLNSRGYFCGDDFVEVIDDQGAFLKKIYISDHLSNDEMTSFVNGDRGYICGGGGSNTYTDVVDVVYDASESYSTKLPITEGSTYTLNGTTKTASSSQILSYSSKVSGTIKYAEGTVPSS